VKTAAVVLVDVGTGNLHSVHHALQKLGAQVVVTSEPGTIRQGGRIVLPGVGAFGNFMLGVHQRGLAPALGEVVQQGRPLLGICVGMQALFEIGEEMGETAGLGLLRGRVVCFPALPGLKVPHTGWNQLWPQRSSPLLQHLTPGDYAYFNHSYYCVPAEPADILTTTEYGLRLASMVQRGNLYGVQFHPEKSQRVGLQILENFLGVDE
jgi:imidazole glycerol-phosphate synthase subunit HisH